MVGGFISKATISRPFFRKLALNNGLQLLFAVAMLGSLYFVITCIHWCFLPLSFMRAQAYTFNNYFTFCLSSFPNNAGIASGLTAFSLCDRICYEL